MYNAAFGALGLINTVSVADAFKIIGIGKVTDCFPSHGGIIRIPTGNRCDGHLGAIWASAGADLQPATLPALLGRFIWSLGHWDVGAAPAPLHAALDSALLRGISEPRRETP